MTQLHLNGFDEKIWTGVQPHCIKVSHSCYWYMMDYHCYWGGIILGGLSYRQTIGINSLKWNNWRGDLMLHHGWCNECVCLDLSSLMSQSLAVSTCHTTIIAYFICLCSDQRCLLSVWCKDCLCKTNSDRPTLVLPPSVDSGHIYHSYKQEEI